MTDGNKAGGLVVAINDLIFATKIRTTAESLGIGIAMARDSGQVAAVLEKQAPSLLLVDLNTLAPDPIDAVRVGCAHACAPVVIAFVAHVDERLAKEAADAGADHVIPRSKFSADLPNIIEKHCHKAE